MNIIFVTALFLFWLVLSASFSVPHLITGALVSILVVWLNAKNISRKQGVSILSALTYGPWLFIRIMKSGFHVCKLILLPSMPIKPEMLEVLTELENDGELTVLGNSITLTPGTITIEIEPGKLMVHALDKDSQADVKSGALENKVGAIFKRGENSS